ncbi:olfactory receptor 10R2 [Dama dama]|uniref:olfactory receptor 10R2 n=1 Tax=Dama dama TaxID=30532 RepID=UPI002A36D1DE|nr:olfactory receptor 10R2 [Dama dama]
MTSTVFLPEASLTALDGGVVCPLPEQAPYSSLRVLPLRRSGDETGVDLIVSLADGQLLTIKTLFASDDTRGAIRVLAENLTMVTEFLLLGFSSLGDIQLVLFAVFLFLYLVILSGNVTIVSVIRLDKSLHTPMYFFLGILSTSETCYTFVILPKMLINLFSVARTISFNCCAIQMFFFLGFAITNCLLLGVMGYDRYAAICHPLHYPILMSWQVCGKLGALCGIGGFLASLTLVYLVFSLPFCSANKVNHYFCDISPVIRLACTNTDAHEFVIFICGVLVLVVPFLFICVSYICILKTILKIPSAEGRRKAFSTCASHLTVVIIHYGCASYIYLRPTANYVSNKDRLVTVTYTIVTPLLNPMVYSLRNKDVQVAIRKVLGKKGSLKLFD